MVLDKIALLLSIIGGINWGLIGFLDFNLVALLFGDGALSRIIYGLVGVSALWCIRLLFANTADGSSRTE